MLQARFPQITQQIITITTDLLCAPYKQNDGTLHCHDILTLKTVLNKKSLEASLESFDRARRCLQFWWQPIPGSGGSDWERPVAEPESSSTDEVVTANNNDEST